MPAREADTRIEYSLHVTGNRNPEGGGNFCSVHPLVEVREVELFHREVGEPVHKLHQGRAAAKNLQVVTRLAELDVLAEALKVGYVAAAAYVFVHEGIVGELGAIM